MDRQVKPDKSEENSIDYSCLFNFILTSGGNHIKDIIRLRVFAIDTYYSIQDFILKEDYLSEDEKEKLLEKHHRYDEVNEYFLKIKDNLKVENIVFMLIRYLTFHKYI